VEAPDEYVSSDHCPRILEIKLRHPRRRIGDCILMIVTGLPTGTLTLLFSDIEGSTVLLHRLGPRWGEALSAHRAIMRTAFAEHHGTEMGTEGDSFFVVFRSAQQAVESAVVAQRGLRQHAWPDGVELKVRMGIHSGEPQRHEDGYIGEDVHRAARIGSIANGGQIVVSATTQLLVRDLPGVSLRDLGHHRLKDLAGSDQLFDVVAPGLPEEFPSLRSLGRVAALPAWTTPLVGRETELRTLIGVITEPMTRLVTLTGPGGSGKTRLATAVAAAAEPTYPDGVFFVGLSAATDATTTWSAIRDALDLAIGSSGDLGHQVATQLGDRNALLLLDNLEQIPDADAVVSALLSAAPRVDVVASSRRPLLLVGEREFPVAPLALPASSDFDAVMQSPAVTLFAQQAKLARPRFEVTEDNHLAVATLCRKLDGLPLALELAAAQSRLLAPSALLSRINGQLGSAFAAPDRPGRQRTLHDMIAWSYDLLAEPEKAVFRRLGVFCASADLNAIDTVAGGHGTEVLDVISRLVSASIVRVDEAADGEPRIGMLETIRSFALERLDESGEGDAVRTRHLTWCAAAIDEAIPLLRGNLHTVGLDRLGALDDDVRAALRFALDTTPNDPNRTTIGLQLLITVTTKYWYLFGSVTEARMWQERALVSSGDADSEAKVGLLYGLGISVLQQGLLPESIELMTRSLEMARRLGQLDSQARALNVLAVARRQGGEFTASMELLRASIEICRQTGNADIESKALGNLVVVYHDLGEFEQAARAAEDSIRVNTARGDDWAVAIDRVNYISAVLKLDGGAAAAARYREWIPTMLTFAETELFIDVIEVGGAIAAQLDQAALAAQLLAAADTRRSTMGMPRTIAEAARVDEWVRASSDALSVSEWQATYDSGTTITPAQAVDLVCSLAAREVNHWGEQR
jgi:predicted ATPase/class 3 adenylate cyclase